LAHDTASTPNVVAAMMCQQHRVRQSRFERVPFVVSSTRRHEAVRDTKEAPSMRYLLLIYTEEPTETAPEDVMAAEIEGYDAFSQEVRDRGLYEAGEALHPTASATTVRVRDGQTVTTDGPFAETKEQLGGFYLIKARDLDEAIEVAAKIPGAKRGSVEVRPIFDFGPAEGSAQEAVGATG
jgi:hypothetical protein